MRITTSHTRCKRAQTPLLGEYGWLISYGRKDVILSFFQNHHPSRFLQRCDSTFFSPFQDIRQPRTMIRMGSSEIGTSESTGLSSLLYSLNGHLEGIPQFHTHSNHLITDRSILIHWVTPCHAVSRHICRCQRLKRSHWAYCLLCGGNPAVGTLSCCGKPMTSGWFCISLYAGVDKPTYTMVITCHY